jgi:alkanesulfonate monooxygenase SsuD/methylene tetrahydromethanopterin reductase-like flavin-dependent oxidoreductase (luciferase family)
VTIFAVVAETDAHAQALAISFDDWLLQAESATPANSLMPPDTVNPARYTAEERDRIRLNRKRVVIGDGPSALVQLQRVAEQYQTDQIMVIPMMPGEDNRQRAIEVLAAANRESRCAA